MKSIAFLLPKEKPYAVGGYKVVLEYANRLAADGFKVYLVYSSSLFWEHQSLITKLKVIAYHLKMKWQKHTRTELWFQIDSRIKQMRVLTLNERFVVKADCYVATAVQTAIYLNRFSIPNDRKYYLIQGFENFCCSDEIVYETYKYGMHNIAISKWLKRKIENCGANAVLIPNGFDFNYFRLSDAIESRSPYRIAFMYHIESLKGCDVAMRAFNIVKDKYPQLRIQTFSAYPRPSDMPEWYDYYNLPDKETINKIYNTSSIYVGASRVEGWGLTVGEAMICGCAVVCTNNDGYLEMATPEFNAVVVPIDDDRELADAIIRVIKDQSLRYRIAYNGRKTIESFSCDQSYQLFKKVVSVQS